MPPVIPAMRLATQEDFGRLAAWVEAGRREGVFLDGAKVDRDTIREYHAAMASRGDFECYIVGSAGGDKGYVDFRYHGADAEILGIYLEPSARRRNLGSHLLRWACHYLSEHGAVTVVMDIYDDNAAGRRAARRAGFAPSLATKQEAGRLLRTHHRELRPYERLAARPLTYPAIAGTNLVHHHRAIADAIAGVLSTVDDVDLILGLGSVSRGFADAWSDVDIAVLGRVPGVLGIPRGELWSGEYPIDLFVIDRDAAAPATWDGGRREAFHEGVVLFSRLPSLLDDVRSHVALGVAERRTLIGRNLLELGWIGFQPRAYYERIVHGYHWSLPHDLWMRRGDVASAHATIDDAVHHLFATLFLINGHHVPDRKWMRFLVRSLEWLPAGFSSRVERLNAAGRDAAAFDSRAAIVLDLIDETFLRAEQDVLLDDDLYRSYLASSNIYG